MFYFLGINCPPCCGSQLVSNGKPDYLYSSPPLIRPLYLPRNCGHIREVVFDATEGEVNALIVVRTQIYGHITEGGLC